MLGTDLKYLMKKIKTLNCSTKFRR